MFRRLKALTRLFFDAGCMDGEHATVVTTRTREARTRCNQRTAVDRKAAGRFAT